MVIGVVGGIGKTSTKLAIAQLLGKTLRVRYQAGNYNDIVSVPLVFFGQTLPSLVNPFTWIKIFMDNARQIRGDYPFDVVVVELGTDRVGQIAAFQAYLQLDYAIITAIVPEHMAYFSDLDAVAKEELAVATYAKKLIYNADLVAETYRRPLRHATAYGSLQPAEYTLADVSYTAGKFSGNITRLGKPFLPFTYEAISEVQLYGLLAAVVMGNELGLTRAQLTGGIAAIGPVSGRLRLLPGMHNSLIIDDTYNALPDAVKTALQLLYKMKAPQKIAILGNMNQLGAMSASAHKEIGELCDPTQLDLVVTIGHDANIYLALAASARGCTVKSFDTPYEAGMYLQPKVTEGALILAKGSQDAVFAEEAVKLLLRNPADASKLVRQSDYWLKRKRKCFQRVGRP
jgi:UDP-N-acetylmuramoyl-tripeptide--D-alanyl-D-alanine ligase